MYNLFIHQWKEKVRSPFWQKSILLNILLGILGLYLVLNIIIVSFFADKIILEVFDSHDVVKVFTGLLFYYFSFDLIIRFLTQQLPILSIQPYLTLPIKKSQLLHYPLLKSTMSFLNIIAVLLFIPFFIKNIWSTQSIQFSVTWIITVFSLVGVNNYLNFFLKKYFSKKPLLPFLFILGLAFIVYLDFAEIYSLSEYFTRGVYYLADNPILIVMPVLMLALSYFSVYTFLKKNAFIEDSQNREVKRSRGLSILEQYGEIGQLIDLEIKMVLRNKRPRSLLIVSCIFFLYGFLFYRQENMDSYLILSFLGVFLPTAFSLNFGQFLFSWESSYFDSILVSKISPINYVKSKYLFLSIASILGYFITLPYAFIEYKIALINAAFLLYNIGIASIILLYFCTFNTSHIDLGKGQFMNFQGVGAMQYLIIIPILGIPFIIYFILKYLENLDYYYYTIAVIGFIGIVLNKYLLQLVTNQLLKRKYKMALGFRQK